MILGSEMMIAPVVVVVAESASGDTALIMIVVIQTSELSFVSRLSLLAFLISRFDDRSCYFHSAACFLLSPSLALTVVTALQHARGRRVDAVKP